MFVFHDMLLVSKLFSIREFLWSAEATHLSLEGVPIFRVEGLTKKVE